MAKIMMKWNSIKAIVTGVPNDNQHQNNAHPKTSNIECDGVLLTNAQCHMVPISLVAYGSGKRMVTGTRAGSRIQTRNFKWRFLPHHKSKRRDIWCTNSPVVSCFNPKFVDRSVPYEAKQRRVKFRRCFGNIPLTECNVSVPNVRSSGTEPKAPVTDYRNRGSGNHTRG